MFLLNAHCKPVHGFCVILVRVQFLQRLLDFLQGLLALLQVKQTPKRYGVLGFSQAYKEEWIVLWSGSQ